MQGRLTIRSVSAIYEPSDGLVDGETLLVDLEQAAMVSDQNRLSAHVHAHPENGG